MKINYRKLGLVLCGLLFIGDAFGINSLNKRQARYRSVHTNYEQALSSDQHQNYKHKHPVIRKTVPAAFKQMMSTGKFVTRDEDAILNIYRNSKNGEPSHSTPQYKHYQSDLAKYVTSGLDGEMLNGPWINQGYQDHVKLVPGALTYSGDCQCAFILVSPKGRVDMAYTATYKPSSQMFTDFSVYQVRHNVTLSTNGSLSDTYKKVVKQKSKKHAKAKKAGPKTNKNRKAPSKKKTGHKAKR